MVCRNTVGACVLSVMAIMGLVGVRTEVVGREHTGHCQKELATQLEMPEDFLCARLENC